MIFIFKLKPFCHCYWLQLSFRKKSFSVWLLSIIIKTEFLKSILIQSWRTKVFILWWTDTLKWHLFRFLCRWWASNIEISLFCKVCTLPDNHWTWQQFPVVWTWCLWAFTRQINQQTASHTLIPDRPHNPSCFNCHFSVMKHFRLCLYSVTFLFAVRFKHVTKTLDCQLTYRNKQKHSQSRSNLFLGF